MPTVWVVGSINEDVVAQAPRAPGPGETVLGTSIKYGCGGKGANQAVAAARAGAHTILVSATGDDDAGSRQRAALDATGVDTTGITISDQPTGTAVITVDDEGENSIVVIPGANATITGTAVEVALTAVKADDVVLAQGEIPRRAIEAAAVAARRAGASFALNLAPVIPLELAQLSVDVLIVNEHEASLLVRRDQTIEDRATTLRSLAHAVVVTMGARGALVASSAGLTHLPAIAAQRVVDTTGAGDAFCGALAARFAKDRDILAAANWGLAAGALAVAAHGAQGADTSAPAIENALAAASAH